MVYNMAMDELSKIIKDNINDLLLKNKALDNIAKNSNKLLFMFDVQWFNIDYQYL